MRTKIKAEEVPAGTIVKHAPVDGCAAYTPPGSTSREASDERYADYAAALQACPLVEAVKIIPRVGLDVRASCGTFLAPAEIGRAA